MDDFGSDELPVFVKWFEFLEWLLNATEKIPKNVRFTLTQRIENYALDVLDLLIEARYSKNKLSFLLKINLKLERLRILFRICNQRKFISIKSYSYAVSNINIVGRMVGGWVKQQDNYGK